MDEDALKAVLERYLADHLCRSGQVLYSGIDTLRPGRYYFLAFNPAADGTNPRLRDVPLGRTEWSAYVDQCWHCDSDRRDDCGHPPTRHQARLAGIMAALGRDPRGTFATNLFFVESRTAEDLNVGELWNPHWAVHREMLAVVVPERIVCIGNGEELSAFALLREAAGRVEQEEQQDRLKGFVGTFDLGRGR